MNKKSLSIIILIICFGLILSGCPKKTVVKEEPSLKKAEELAAEREKVAKLEAERAAKEALEKELLRRKEEEAKRALAEKELQAERERAARLEAEKAKALKEIEALKERAAKLEAERAAKEAKEKELVKAREEEPQKALAEKGKEFEKSLVAKKYPGIEGEVLESHLIKDIQFDFDKYDIRPWDAEILKENAALLMKHPKVKIQIEGHCDERGTNEYNLALGERRANSAKNYLISLGIASDRISSISYGEERPLVPGHNEEAWAKNRRAHFVILSK